MLLGGTSKSCKSWTLLEMALAVAGGKPWWGFETTASRVLYANFELPEWSLAKRIAALGTAMALEHRFTPEAVNNFDIWNLRGYAADLALLLPQLKEKVAEGYGMIVMDPLYKMVGAQRDENDAASMGDLFNSLESLAQSSGAAIVVSHHYAKGNAAVKSAQDRVSGSGVMARDPDSMIMLTPHEEEDMFAAEFVLRHHAQPAPFCVRWAYPLMRRDDEADPGELRGHAGVSKKLTSSDVLKIVGSRLVTKPELIRELQAAHHVSAQTIYRRLSEMQDAGAIIYSNGFLKAQNENTNTQ